ncbi:hypothetical protein T07_13632 [Trichinella nelsoni]|uniref:Uncharacterized protein n=1 Tax=Trichinella nelsoni TaxID=6336 RepID=A0A0V0RZJ6_9BILA|nr:hypothetical protein T07_13632 [Trichinella nelsoni]
MPPIPFTVTVSAIPTRPRALAVSSVTRVCSAPLSNKQLTVSRCPFAPEDIAFTLWNRIRVGPRVLASNTRGVISSQDSDRVFFSGGVIELSDVFVHDDRRLGAVSVSK